MNQCLSMLIVTDRAHSRTCCSLTYNTNEAPRKLKVLRINNKVNKGQPIADAPHDTVFMHSRYVRNIIGNVNETTAETFE
jgi:hypothetical protein